MGMRGWWSRRFDVVFRKRMAEDELDEEMKVHLEFEIEDLVKTGLSRAEARRHALVAFGGVERFKEEVRDVRGVRLLDDVIQDVRVATRSLVKQPVFLVATVLTLALGIGGTVAMFGVLERTLFTSLPYPDSHELVTGRSTFGDGASLGPVLAGTDLVDYAAARSFAKAGAIMPFVRRVTLDDGSGVERADLIGVSTSFFSVLGVSPVAGRTFAEDEGTDEAGRVAVLSEPFWNRRYGGDPGAVGSMLRLNGVAHTIVGVMPSEARFMVDADIWTPLIDLERRGRNAHNYLLVGRLRSGVGMSTAQAELDGTTARLQEAFPDTNDGKGIVLAPTRDVLVERYRGTVALLIVAVAMLLVVACTNVAGLLTARGTARVGEISVRSALGAGRGRLTRQLLTESVLLALGAGALGLVIASFGHRGILGFVSFDQLAGVDSGLSGSTVAFAVAVSLGTVLLFGVVPALRATQVGSVSALRSGTRGSREGGSTTLRSGLVVAQVVVTVVLTSMAGLLVRSFRALDAVDLGFDPASLLTADVDVPPGVYGADARVAFYEELRSRVERLRGVESVGVASRLPVRGPGNNWGVSLPAVDGGGDPPKLLAHQRTVMPGYFDAMGIPLLAGRDVEATDRDIEPAALVVSATTARRLFGEADPLGRVVHVQGNGDEPFTEHRIVGVVGDVRMDDAASGPDPAMYYAYHRRTPTRMALAIRTVDGPGTVPGDLREIVRALDPSVPVDGLEPLQSITARRSTGRRALAALVAVFGGVAVVLSAVGLYGVMAYLVTMRTREIGVKMALGSSTSRVSGDVLRQGLRLVGIGLALGVPLAMLGGRLARGFLFGVPPVDPVTYGGVALLLGGVATVACLLPARRAARIDPVVALRAE